MKIAFTKMEGCGNDYVYINGFTEKIPQEKKKELVTRLSDRHFGIGSDGVIFINPSKNADFEMEMYNADGTRSEMCGNGVRCVARYVYDHGLTDHQDFVIESMGQKKDMHLYLQDGAVTAVRVNMGPPILQAEKIPVIAPDSPVVRNKIEALGEVYEMTCVSMGNPHCVIFVDDVAHFPVEKVGPVIEHSPRFPNRVNVEFVQVIDRENVRMRVWERGTGETMACGTGCCATTVACVLNNRTKEHVKVEVLGGELLIHWDQDENTVWMTGPATEVFSGTMDMR